MPPVSFLPVEVVLHIHRRVVEEFGGDPGLRDRGLLESAVAMPQARFAGEYLHTGLAEKASAYHYHLCANHPFVDGNKRVAVVAAEVFLLSNGFELAASDKDLEKVTLGVAGGRLSKQTVVEFFKHHVVEVSL